MFADDVLIIDNSKTEISNIGKYLSFYEDKSNKLTINDILKMDNQFIKSKVNVPNHGFSYSTYWHKFNLNINQTDYLMSISWALFKNIEVFYVNDQNITTFSSSYINKNQTEEIISKNFVFKIPSGDYQIYIKTSTPFSIHLPVQIIKSNSFYYNEIIKNILYGLFFGIILAILIYNLFLWISIKDNNYIIYVLYLTSQFIYNLTYSGFFKILIPSFSEKLFEFLFVISVFGVMFFAILFTKMFLEIKNTLSKINVFFVILLVLQSLQLLIIPFNVMIPIIISDIIGIMGIPLLFTSSLFLLYKGYKQARYYTVAWFFCLSTGGLVMMKNLGFIIDNYITSYSVYFGTILELLLLSFALGDKYNIMKKEKEKLQQIALETQTKLKNEAEKRLKITEIYTRRSIVEKIKKGEDPTSYKPENKRITILFSDIRDFTTISENLSAIETVELLNSYFNEMNDCIMQLGGGEIDKLIGDCIMALFDDPDKSIHSAIQMREKLMTFNLQNKIKIRVNNGIGINYGEVVLGNIGSKTKMDYTVIGDIVNSASRIESLTKYYGLPIIISEELKNSLKENYKIRFIDEVLVKGKKQPTRIYEVFDYEKEDIIKMKSDNQSVINDAFEYYKKGHFNEANKIYSDLIKRCGNHNFLENKCSDPLLNFYFDRCIKLQEQKEAGLLDNWNGIYEFVDK